MIEIFPENSKYDTKHKRPVPGLSWLGRHIPAWEDLRYQIFACNPNLRVATILLERDGVKGLTPEQKAALFVSYARNEAVDASESGPKQAYSQLYAPQLKQHAVAILQKGDIAPERLKRFEGMVALQRRVEQIKVKEWQRRGVKKAKYPFIDELKYTVYSEYIRMLRQGLSLSETEREQRGRTLKDIYTTVRGLPEFEGVTLPQVSNAMEKLVEYGVAEWPRQKEVENRRIALWMQAAYTGEEAPLDVSGATRRADKAAIRNEGYFPAVLKPQQGRHRRLEETQPSQFEVDK